MNVALKVLQDCLGGGAWPFVVRVLRCQLNCGNERDGVWVLARGQPRDSSRLGSPSHDGFSNGEEVPQQQVCDAL